eukprot:760290-Hanusia_phi.AAC.6
MCSDFSFSSFKLASSSPGRVTGGSGREEEGCSGSHAGPGGCEQRLPQVSGACEELWLVTPVVFC